MPKPVILWDPLYLDWEALRSGLIDSFQLTATNVGLIAVDNLQWKVPPFWENYAFITTDDKNLGRLPANSSLSFPVEVKPFIRYNIPTGWVELRGEDPDNIVFTPEDPALDTGLEFIVIGADNPGKQWYYKFDQDNVMIYSYSYDDRTRYDYVYNGTFLNGTEIPVDVVITNNTNLTTTRRLFEGLPLPLERRLGIENPLDCALLALCIGEFTSYSLALDFILLLF